MSRLPTVGSDSGNWGTILNDFLSVSHTAGGLLQRTQAVTTSLSNGDNNDVTLSSTHDYIKINSGPSASFAITGIAGGSDGRKIIIQNATTQVFTLRNQSSSSSATNRIITNTASDMTLVSNGMVSLMYDADASRWIVEARYPEVPVTREVTTTSATSVTIDSSVTDIYSITALAAAITFNAPSSAPEQGKKLLIRIKDNGTARAITWNAVFKPIGVTLPTTTVISKLLYLLTVYNSTSSQWDVLAVGQEA